MRPKLLLTRKPKSSACRRLMRTNAYRYYEELMTSPEMPYNGPKMKLSGVSKFAPVGKGSGDESQGKMIQIEKSDMPGKTNRCCRPELRCK